MNHISSIKLGGSIEYNRVRPKKSARHDYSTEDESQGYRRGKNAVNWGNKIRLNGTPTDTTGHIMQGANDADFENTYDKAWDKIEKLNDGYIFTEWTWDGEHMGGPVDFGSMLDNFGCTPTVKAQKRDEDSERHKLVVWQVYGKGTKFEVKSNELEFAID